MINLLPTSAVADVRLIKVKRVVATVTTVILVGYVLLLAGLAGSDRYLAGREQTVSTQVAGLTSQVGQLAEVEVVLRQQDDRLKSIRQILDSRPDLARIASELGAANVIDWDSDGQKVAAVGSDAASLESYANGLQGKFRAVKIETLSRLSDGQWQIELLLAGGNP